MGKVLVVAEKPSVGRDIAKVLNCNGKGDGFLFSDEYIVSWAIGHLVTLFEPEDYGEEYKKWKMQTLPILPPEIKLKPIASTKSQLSILKKLFNDKEVESLICATDSGREGELIFRYIYMIMKCKKPFKRLWISSMTDTAIKEGFRTLKDGTEYDNLFLSAKCRSEADWLVGMNATRAYTIKYDTLLSIGRVQTPTLAIIVDRQKEINAFDSKDYWEIKATFQANELSFSGMWFEKETRETKIQDKLRAEEIAAKVTGKQGTVAEIENEEKRQPPPQLFDLTELQRECNRKFGFSAQKTLQLAQDLYEKRKLITYPRTDSRYLSDDMIPKIGYTLKKLLNTEYKSHAEYVLTLPKLPITKRIIDNSKVSDHHAIIPTDININTKVLSGDEFSVYDAIVKKFLAVFYAAYVYNITRIISIVSDEHFMTKGTTIIDLGYMEIYKNEKNSKKSDKDKDDEEEILPNVTKGQTVDLSVAKVLQKKTQPPKPYNEASLLSAMENAGRFVEDETLKEQLKDSGLGTPATRAATIERLLQVGYIERKGKTVIPTEKGMKLIEIVPLELRSPETTGKWEKGLTSISKGKMDNSKFMASITRYVNFIVSEANAKKVDVKFPDEPKKETKRKEKPLGVCPKCGNGQIYENTKAFYCSAWKTGCKFTVWKNELERHGGQLSNEIVEKLLKDKVVKGLDLVMPQTNEKCKADLVFKEDYSGILLENLTRV